MSVVQTIEVTPSEDGMRLDRWFKAHYPGIGHGGLQRMFRTGQVRLDGARVKANARVAAGQMVRVPPIDWQQQVAKPKRKSEISDEDRDLIQSLVLYRDASVIAVNKPSGLAVQGGSKTDRHVDGMLDALTFEAEERPRLVHRLDRDTSGVLLLARNRKVAAALARSFEARQTEKTYWTLVAGVPRPDRGKINMPLAKVGREGDQRMAPVDARDQQGQHAETVYAMIDHAGRRFCWLALSPLTGRTHQLRVHMAAIGHPVIGDGKYGGQEIETGEELPKQLHLHARALKLDHPDGGDLDLVAPLPAHMKTSWQFLGFNEADGDTDILFGE